MTPLEDLNYFLSNIIQWILFLIGSLLVLIPIYHTLNNKSSTFLKASLICKQRLGMHRFSNLYNYNNKKQIDSFSTLDISDRSTATTAVAILGLLKDINKLDTQVCLLPSNNNDETLLVSGLVNTGNSCFLNSVLQSLSALPKLQAYLSSVDISPTTTSHNLPVTRSLLKTLRLLSIPSNTPFKPIEIVSAMSSNRRVIINREQQDAQELFQLISSELDNESQHLKKKQQGFRDILSLSLNNRQKAPPFLSPSPVNNKMMENPFTGLLANRLSCTHCGYTEAIRHFSFNNVQLTLPNADTTHLDDCLKQLTTMEYLNDVTCRKCSLIDTIQQLSLEIDSLQQQTKMEKLQVLQKMKQEIEHRLKMGRIEDLDDSSKKLKGFISKIHRVCSKQAMFANPPKVLCLHIARSAFGPTGEIYKNTCQIQFPEVLDLSPYCTNGTLNTQPNLPISSSSATTTPGAKYRLMSSIIHYGSHNFGHFIAYKRRLVVEKCPCHTCANDATLLKHHDSDWFKISDERVSLCGIEQVLEANPYMLLYELIEEDHDVDNTLQQAKQDVKVAATELSTVVVDQVAQEEEEEEEDWLNNVPAAPPSSPLLLPHQLANSSIVTSCSSSQPLITKPQQRRHRRGDSSKQNLWTKTPVAIY